MNDVCNHFEEYMGHMVWVSMADHFTEAIANAEDYQEVKENPRQLHAIGRLIEVQEEHLVLAQIYSTTDGEIIDDDDRISAFFVVKSAIIEICRLDISHGSRKRVTGRIIMLTDMDEQQEVA